MIFNSFSFFVFLGFIVALYYFIPSRWRWFLLLIGSYYFYMFQEPQAGLWLALTTVVSYLCALGIAKSERHKKSYLVLGILFNLGALLATKYLNFFLLQFGNIFTVIGLSAADSALPKIDLKYPAGLSFYTFAAIAYLVDVYKGKMAAENNLTRMAVYFSFFPKVFAGPIERARTFLPQMINRIQLDPERFTQGLQLILWGLFKKVVIADRLAVFVNAAYGNVGYVPPLDLLLASYFFALQIYCDFSGYTDIAIGTSKILGFDLMDNFRRPYLSRSTPEFWGGRWHISLATWFRDYLYIPLGGSRVSRPRHYFNLMMVFAVSGIWHAGMGMATNWTFLIWGALNGFYQWVSVFTGKFWQRLGGRFPKVQDSKIWHVLRVVFTFHLITLSWIFFRANSISDAFKVLERIGKNVFELPTLIGNYPFSWEHYISFALIVFLVFIEVLDEKKSLWERLRLGSRPVRWAFYYALILGLMILGNWQLPTFIYMQF
jgi:alginate O-acetyltransferase complex protein AlgI